MIQIGNFFSSFVPDFSVVRKTFTSVSERISRLLGFETQQSNTSILKSPDQLF